MYCGVKRNFYFRTLFIEDIQTGLGDILSAEAVTDKFWYIINHNRTLIGCIGGKEYSQICETGKMAFNKDFFYIHTGVREKQEAIYIFMTNNKIRKLPVLDANGKLLYEYIRSIEAYYDELSITCGINTQDTRGEKIAVSLTSFGCRMDTVHLAIKSIMTQTIKADEIVLYLAKEDSQKKIKQEEELIKAGLKIERNVEDLKSHKKYFYSMQEYPENLIVTVDDDAIYDDRLIEDLYTKHLEYPEAVICRRGHRMTKVNGKITPYGLWEGCVESKIPEKGICATGVGGILYPCGKYRKAFLDKKGIIETALYGDDLWLKTVELIWEVSTYAIGELPANIIEGSQKEALYKENADNKRNDKYLDELQRYFNINLADLF